MLDPRYRYFHLLSRTEATELLAEYVARLPERVDAFVDEVRRRGGPVEALDYSRASLRPLWTWFIATLRVPDPPATDDEMRRTEPPWWYDFHAALAQRLGPDMARLVTNMAAYFVETALRQRPDAKIVLGRGKGTDGYNEPLLQIGPAGGQVDSRFIVLALHAAKGDSLQTDPGRLESIFDLWMGPPSSAPDELSSPYSVELSERGAPGGFTHVISFDDVVAHEEEPRIARLVHRLANEPGIEQSAWEDREMVLVKAPQLGVDLLTAIVERLWKESRSPS